MASFIVTGTTLKDLDTNVLEYLDPFDYTSEWTKGVYEEIEMADSSISLIKAPKQNPKILINEEMITRDRYQYLYNISKNTGKLYEFTDEFGNKAKVIVLPLKQPPSQYKKIQDVNMILLVKQIL